MCPSFNSFGSNPSVSQLVWDTDLVIPDGKAIESASGEVGIVGDVSVSGSVSADNMVTSASLTATNAKIGTLILGNRSLRQMRASAPAPITVSTTSKSYTVTNPYGCGCTGTLTASAAQGTSSFIRLNDTLVMALSGGQSDTATITLAPGANTLTQSGVANISLSANELVFYGFY